ncbi:MAG: MarR family transcriptional regulator [Roseovarius sp.]
MDLNEPNPAPSAFCQSHPILCNLLARARDATVAPMRRMLRSAGLSEQQWRVLRLLAEAGEMEASALAEGTGLLFPSLTRMNQALLRKGLISQRRDSRDRRRQRIGLTPKGRELVRAHIAEAEAIERAMRAAMGKEDYRRLLVLLERLCSAKPAVEPPG